MPGDQPTFPLTLPDRDTASRIRDVLVRTEFTTTRPLQLADVLEKGIASFRPQRRQLAIGLRRTIGGSPLEVLTGLFLLGRAVSRRQASQAVAPTELDAWVRTGLLAVAGEQVRACC